MGENVREMRKIFKDIEKVNEKFKKVWIKNRNRKKADRKAEVTVKW